MGSSGLPKLYGTIGASPTLTLYTLRAICIQKAWRHYFPRPGCPLLFKKARHFIRVLPLAGSAVIFCRCDINPDQTVGERAPHPRGARPRTDSHNCRPADLSVATLLLPGSASANVSNSATRDATSGRGALACS